MSPFMDEEIEMTHLNKFAKIWEGKKLYKEKIEKTIYFIKLLRK